MLSKLSVVLIFWMLLYYILMVLCVQLCISVVFLREIWYFGISVRYGGRYRKSLSFRTKNCSYYGIFVTPVSVDVIDSFEYWVIDDTNVKVNCGITCRLKYFLNQRLLIFYVFEQKTKRLFVYLVFCFTINQIVVNNLEICSGWLLVF